MVLCICVANHMMSCQQTQLPYTYLAILQGEFDLFPDRSTDRAGLSDHSLVLGHFAIASLEYSQALRSICRSI
jgi:hypothetical protein